MILLLYCVIPRVSTLFLGHRRPMNSSVPAYEWAAQPVAAAAAAAVLAEINVAESFLSLSLSLFLSFFLSFSFCVPGVAAAGDESRPLLPLPERSETGQSPEGRKRCRRRGCCNRRRCHCYYESCVLSNTHLAWTETSVHCRFTRSARTPDPAKVPRRSAEVGLALTWWWYRFPKAHMASIAGLINSLSAECVVFVARLEECGYVSFLSYFPDEQFLRTVATSL